MKVWIWVSLYDGLIDGIEVYDSEVKADKAFREETGIDYAEYANARQGDDERFLLFLEKMDMIGNIYEWNRIEHYIYETELH